MLWVIFQRQERKKGHFPEQMHIELMEAVQAIIPKGTKVVVLGDKAHFLKKGKALQYRLSAATSTTTTIYA
jgi:hypothetical protein